MIVCTTVHPIRDRILMKRFVFCFFLLQLQESSCSQAMILLGDFNQTDICWTSGTANCKQSRKLLKCIENNFQSMGVKEPNQRRGISGSVPHQCRGTLSGRSRLKVVWALGSDHALIWFSVLRDTQTQTMLRITWPQPFKIWVGLCFCLVAAAQEQDVSVTSSKKSLYEYLTLKLAMMPVVLYSWLSGIYLWTRHD